MLEDIDLKRVLILDIETVPQYPSFGEVPEQYRNLWEYKTRLQRKDGETAEDYYPRGGIWAEFGKIICISLGAFSQKDQPISLRIKSLSGDNEAVILSDFTNILKAQSPGLYLCAHNGREFDFPYLCRRMLINNVAIPPQLRIQGKKPWEVQHIDTLDLWKFGDHKNYTSLDLLAAVFGIPSPKADINGSDVYKVYWHDRDLPRITRYCEKDVVTTAQLLLRFKGLSLLEPCQIVSVA